MGPIETTAGHRRPVWKLLTTLLVGLAGACLLTGTAWGLLGPGGSSGGGTSSSGPLSALSYTIRTRFGTDCAQERVVNATIGVPQVIFLDGSILPDAIVELVAIPGQAGLPDILDLSVVKTRLTTLRALVEVTVTPDTASAERIAVGYDACRTGAPGVFTALMTSAADQLSVNATTVAPTNELTVIGSTFDAAGAIRVDPTALAARFAPVPTNLSAVVDIVGPTSYEATVESSRPTKARLDYSTVDGAARTSATAVIDRLPETLDLAFDSDSLAYLASDEIDQLDLDVELYDPTDPPGPDEPDLNVSRLGATLVGVPATATLERTSETAVQLDAPDSIDEATVRFASFLPGSTLPTLTALPDQYLVADVAEDVSVAQVKVLGLSRAVVDAGDHVVVDVTHTAGPFHVGAAVESLEEATETEPEHLQSRHLDVDVLDLPGTARVTFNTRTQEFTYDGSDVIELLTADVESNLPLVDDATRSSLRIEDVPTGLTGQVDTKNKTFEATLTGGALSLLEVQVTSDPEPDVRLPVGTQGVRVEDHEDSYGAFVRILGLSRAEVSWGTTQIADMTHTAGPFVLQVHADDPDDDEMEVEGTIADLPTTARFVYAPGEPITTMNYDGSAEIARLDFDVRSEKTIVDDANELHLFALGVPRDMDVVIDKTAKTAEATMVDSDLDHITLELCDDLTCSLAPTSPPIGDPIVELPGPPGVSLLDLNDRYHASAIVNGFQHFKVDWDEPVVVDVTSAGGPFDIDLQKDKVEIRVIENPPPGPGDHGPGCGGGSPPSDCDPCGFPRHPDIPCDEEEQPPTVIEVPYQITAAVDIRNLPTTTHFEYDPEASNVVYSGSSVIDRVTADYHTTGRSIVGRANYAHLDALGLPTALDLTFAFGASGDNLTVDTCATPPCTATIGQVDARFSSDPGVAVPDFSEDGFVVDDRDDFDGTPREPLEDSYLMMARATNLRHFTYTARDAQYDGFGSDDFDREKHIVLHRAGGPGLRLDVREPNEAKVGGQDYTTIVYDDPPDEMIVDLTVADRNTTQEGAYSWYVVGYRGSSQGTGLNFDTNKGSGRYNMHVGIPTMPSNGLEDGSGLFACLSPKKATCSPMDRSGGHDELSFNIQVAQPIDVTFQDCTNFLSVACEELPVFSTVINAELHIDRAITVMKERVDFNNDFDPANIHIDTKGRPVWGYLRGAGLKVEIPRGFMAMDRYGQVDCDPFPCSFYDVDSGDEHDMGEMVCPDDFIVEADVAPTHKPNFEDEFCPAPIISYPWSEEPAELARGSEVWIDVWGSQFSPASCPDLFGTEWPPCPGPHMEIRRGGLESFFVSVTDVEWIDIGHVRMKVLVDGDADTGLYDIFMDNPTDGAGNDTRSDAIRVV